jgi:hypothetical protein
MQGTGKPSSTVMSNADRLRVVGFGTKTSEGEDLGGKGLAGAILFLNYCTVISRMWHKVKGRH